MAHLVSDITKYLKFDERNIDNWLFKLYHKGCVVLFLTGSLVGIVSQYFGEPISCDFKGVDVEMATDYCWIHGSSYIPKDYQKHMKCIVDLEGVESADDAPDTSYYQWVTFMLIFQAGTFLLPYKVWKAIEGGLIGSFGDDARSAIMLKDDTNYDDGVVLEAVVEKYVKYFKSIFHHNNWYFAKFVCCEMSNIIMLFANFWAIDKFLGGKFRYYGWDIYVYSQMGKDEQSRAINPFCQAFPTEVSCTIPNIGAAGGEQNHNGLCILSQNIINEKMYFVLWLYLVLLMMISLPYMLFRLSTIIFDNIRYATLMGSVGNTPDKDVRKAVTFILSKSHLGDWFVLNQLGKNVNTYFFRAFLKELRHELREKPKRSKSTASAATIKSPAPVKSAALEPTFYKSDGDDSVKKSPENSSLLSDEEV